MALVNVWLPVEIERNGEAILRLMGISASLPECRYVGAASMGIHGYRFECSESGKLMRLVRKAFPGSRVRRHSHTLVERGRTGLASQFLENSSAEASSEANEGMSAGVGGNHAERRGGK